jgi:hypothetical protein
MDYAGAQKIIYGMEVGEWKENYQGMASDEQKKTFEETSHLHAKITGY